MSSDKTCDTCVCRAVCMDFWKNKRCGPRLPHWRGDDAAVLEAARKAIALGHNDDCMFCGFKDKALIAALAQRGGSDE